MKRKREIQYQVVAANSLPEMNEILNLWANKGWIVLGDVRWYKDLAWYLVTMYNTNLREKP